jgi:hypothetical protein
MEGRHQADVVGREGLRHHVDVLALRRVDADADAGIGDHHVGQALARCRRAGGHDAVVCATSAL